MRLVHTNVEDQRISHLSEEVRLKFSFTTSRGAKVHKTRSVYYKLRLFSAVQGEESLTLHHSSVMLKIESHRLKGWRIK